MTHHYVLHSAAFSPLGFHFSSMPLKTEPAFIEEMFDPVNNFLMHRPTEFQQNVQDQSK